MKMNTQLFFSGLVMSGIMACSHTAVKQEFPATASAVEEIQKFDTDMMTASSQQVNVLSPVHFQEAQSALIHAKERQAAGKEAKGTLHTIAEGRTHLDQANEAAKLSHNNMEEVVVARQQAIEASAPTILTKDFRRADEHLREVTTDLEQNNLKGAAKNRAKLQAEYLGLELQAIKQGHLDSAINTIQMAKKEGGAKYAPRSLAIAEKKVKDTDAFITGNRHAKPEVDARSQDAQSAAEHFLKITRNAKAGKNVSGEDAALAMEGEQNKTAVTQTALALTVAEVAARDAQLLTEKGHTLSAQEQTQALEAEKALAARYETARKQFTKSEAEVYKQGNKLLIRLRGLEFPRSKAVLQGSNFPLLAKVQNVIKDFGKSSIVIEGYTDSDGGKEANEKLSNDRAQAVREYFVSAAGVEKDSITAIGYGDQKPLATNNTAKGKAQNRRVDVIITPDTTL